MHLVQTQMIFTYELEGVGCGAWNRIVKIGYKHFINEVYSTYKLGSMWKQKSDICGTWIYSEKDSTLVDGIALVQYM